ncbi:hypothetical protein [Actinokineospora inagensis]|uniref:hypothetical protein n=1 Tax=Actinokineospora inagensis TaxID=103730 RepID=UPI00041EDA2C|nr:hypothetical protein [Actinokineospora inagensis]
MGYARELANPWGLLLAASAGAVAWAIHLTGWLTFGVGLVVLLGRAAIGRRAKLLPVAPAIEPDSAEEVWLRRFEAVREEFGQNESIDVIGRTLRRFAVRASAIVRVEVAADDEVELARLTDTYTALITRLESTVNGVEDLVGAPDADRRLAEIRVAALQTERATRGWESTQEPNSARLRNG